MNTYRWIYLIVIGMTLMGQTSPSPQLKTKTIKEKLALVQLKKAAESGDPKAMYQLGINADDPKEAALWTHKSAEAGYGLAMVTVADLQFRTRSRDRQLPQEERKSAAASYRLAVEKAFPKVLEWANRGDLESMCSIGTGGYTHYDLTSPEEEMKWLRRAAEGGHPIATLRLGEILLLDTSDTLKAEGFRWIRKSADGGDFHAMLEMARKYTHGFPSIGLVPDPDKAMVWINKAIAISGEPEGEFIPTHGLVDPYEAARQRGEKPRPKIEKPKAAPPIPTERK